MRTTKERVIKKTIETVTCDVCGKNISKDKDYGHISIVIYKNNYVAYESNGANSPDLCKSCAATLTDKVTKLLSDNFPGLERYESSIGDRQKLIDLLKGEIESCLS